MEDFSKDTKDILITMVNSEAWKIFETLVRKGAEQARLTATQRQTPLEERLWNSAIAEGREQPLLELIDKIK